MWNPLSNPPAVGTSNTAQPNLDPMLRSTPDETPTESLPIASPEIGTMIKPQIAERWYQSVSGNLHPEYLSLILERAINGAISEQFRLFEEMEEKWIELRVPLFKHKLKACRRKGRIVPPDKPANPDLAKRKCDFATAVWQDIQDWPRTMFNAMDFVGKNLSVHEIDWAIRGIGGRQSVVINKMPWVNYRHLVYWPDSPNLQLIPNLLQYNRVEFPERKFVIFEHLSKSGHAARGALLRPLAWAFLIVLYAQKDWAALAETFGADIAYAFYRDQGNSKSSESQSIIQKILAHLSRIAMRVAAFPEGTKVEVNRVAASGAGGGPPQENIIKYYSDLALKLILGSTLGTDAGVRGARSLGEVQVDETDEVIDWSCILFCQAINDTAMRWLMDFNFAEPGDNPRYELPGANRKDLAALANIIKLLVSVGVQVPERWAHEEFDIPRPLGTEDGGQPAEAVLKNETPQGAFGQTGDGGDDGGGSLTGMARSKFHRLVAAARDGRMAITREQAEQALTAIRDQAIRNGIDMGAFDQIAGPLKSLVARNTNPRDALVHLHATAGQIEPKKLEGIAEEMFTLADLLGRATIVEQAGSRGRKTLTGFNPNHDGQGLFAPTPDGEGTGGGDHAKRIEARRNLPESQKEKTLGDAAIEKAIKNRSDVVNAMQRQGVGSIDFRWSSRGGKGIEKIQAEHGEGAVRMIPEVIAFGDLEEPHGNTRVVFMGDKRVVLTKSEGVDSNHWVLTSYERTQGKGGTGR